MIAVGDKRAIAVRGDYRPVEINVGGRKVAGWTEQAVEGVTQAEFADTYNDRAQVTVQGERLEQVSTSGKNLLPYPYLQATFTRNGITFWDNGDGTVTVDGTATANVSYRCAIWSNVNLPDGTYTASGCPAGGSYQSYRINYAAKDADLVELADSNDMGAGLKITAENGLMQLYAVINITSGTTVDHLVFRPQLELGDTATDYEPYSGGYASPSPEWPQPIHGTEAVVTVSNADTEAVETALPVLYGRDGVCDVLETDVVVDGVHRSRVTRWWNTLIVTGAETWSKSQHYTGDLGVRYDVDMKFYPTTSSNRGISTHYPYNGVNRRGTWLYGGETYLQLRILWDYDTVDDLKAYLAAQYAAGTPVTIVYQLAAPIVELGDPIDVRTLPRSTIIGCTDPFSAVVKTVDRTI